MNGIKTNVVILGSTGSIGSQTLEVIRKFPEKFNVLGLAGGNNIDLLHEQVKEFQPQYIFSRHTGETPVGTHFISMEEMAGLPDVDLVILATAGKAGIGPTFAALRAGKRIALSNKEVLVMAGEIVMSEAAHYHAEILPVDSEHSAIWQCLHAEENNIDRILLTASGGPFYRYSPSERAQVTVKDALNHPTWKMGRKVTIDSATLMNKGLETIEAHWLFSVPYEKIEILIHPQSIVHSLVEFTDGSVKAQLSPPDMRLPIQYALTFPERLPNADFRRLDLAAVGQLTFESVDISSFPCLSLALEAGKRGGTYPAVLCASDETAVDLFLNNYINFSSIATIIEETMNLHHNISSPSIEEVLSADRWAGETAGKIASKRGLWL
jgi:1-deoxy-D-xylulose-5-phosphate reductoisomerase